MLGGLARWLRAAGYEASFEEGIDDAALVRVAADEGRILLSSDRGIFERNVVKRGDVQALFVPRSTPPLEQLRGVLDALGLALRASRCMACGGALVDVSKESVSGDVPPRAFASHEHFWRCASCAKVFWHGTHWKRIERALAACLPTR